MEMMAMEMMMMDFDFDFESFGSMPSQMVLT